MESLEFQVIKFFSFKKNLRSFEFMYSTTNANGFNDSASSLMMFLCFNRDIIHVSATNSLNTFVTSNSVFNFLTTTCLSSYFAS